MKLAKLLLVAALAAGAAAAQAGMGILWSTGGGWVVAAGGDPDSGPGVAASDDVTWQLVYAGPDGVANAVDLSAANWTGGDDVLLAVRSIPAGGGTAVDDTSWDEWLFQQDGDATYVDLAWQTDRSGYVFQRIFQGTPSEGTPYAESGLFAFDPAFAGGPGAMPDNFSFPADGNGLVLDRTIPSSVRNYPLWVGGVQVCETNRTDILGDGTAWFEGTATNGTLTLSNATVIGTYKGVNYPSANIFADEGFDLTIMATGSNRVENAAGVCVICLENLLLAGDGVFDAEASMAGLAADRNLSIVGATVVAMGGDYGLEAGQTFTISNTTVSARGTDGSGISSGGNTIIADSMVDATGKIHGIDSGVGALTVTGTSRVESVALEDGNHAVVAPGGIAIGEGLSILEPLGGWVDEWKVVDANGDRTQRVVIDMPRFSVTVVDGSPTNTTARAGETVTVVANPPEEGKAFVEWSADDANDVEFKPAAAATTTFGMPARAVTVKANFSPIRIDSIPDQEWRGSAVEPDVHVQLEDVDLTLVAGTDYTVSYTNNVDPGTATATVTMAPPRTGHASVTFRILPPPVPPSVSNVVARQRWPWNGLVDVDYEVGGYTTGLVARISFAEQGGAGRSWVASNFLAGAEPSAAPGPHRATWDTAADGATNVVAGSIVATVTLVNLPYVVRYDGNGGVGGSADQKKKRDETFRLNRNPFSREDFLYMAWNTAADGSGVYYVDRQEVVNIGPPGATVTLYACWVGPDYTIQFDANGGVGEMADQTATRGVSTKLNKLAFRRENAYFTGWNTKPDGTGVAIEPSGYVTNPAPYVEGSTLSFTDEVTLYAQWQFVTAWFRVDFEANEGTWMPGYSIMNGDDWQWIHLNTAEKLKPVPYEREGFRFAGWNTKPDGTGVPYEDQEEVYNVSGDYDTPDLFAQWEPVDP